MFYAFSQPPASFVFDPANHFKAVARGQATIQIIDEHTAALVCIGSRDAVANQHNAWLLCYLLAVCGWEQGEAWLTAQLYEAGRSHRKVTASMVMGRAQFDLTVDPGGIITLRATGQSNAATANR